MNNFVYSYPTKVYSGIGAAAEHPPGELAKVGKTVLRATADTCNLTAGVAGQIAAAKSFCIL